MPALAEVIPQSTGDVYDMRPTDNAYGTAARQRANVVNPCFFGQGTDAHVIFWPSLHCALQGFSSVYTYSHRTTGTSELVISLVYTSYDSGGLAICEFLGLPSGITIGRTEPSHSDSASLSLIDTPRSTRARELFPLAEEANRLRDLAGLDPTTLAAIFGVTRQSYHGWQTGVAPMPANRKHLLEALALIEDANARLGGPKALGTWLLSPSSPNGKRPVDYLREREYDVFRGVLLHAGNRPEFARPLVPGARLARELSAEHREGMRRRLRRPAKAGDDAAASGSNTDD